MKKQIIISYSIINEENKLYLIIYDYNKGKFLTIKEDIIENYNIESMDFSKSEIVGYPTNDEILDHYNSLLEKEKFGGSLRYKYSRLNNIELNALNLLKSLK